MPGNPVDRRNRRALLVEVSEHGHAARGIGVEVDA
jgi:hypothetical protein